MKKGILYFKKDGELLKAEGGFMPDDNEAVKVTGEINRPLYEEMIECCDREGRKIKYYIERGIRLAIDENK